MTSNPPWYVFALPAVTMKTRGKTLGVKIMTTKLLHGWVLSLMYCYVDVDFPLTYPTILDINVEASYSWYEVSVASEIVVFATNDGKEKMNKNLNYVFWLCVLELFNCISYMCVKCILPICFVICSDLAHI